MIKVRRRHSSVAGGIALLLGGLRDVKRRIAPPGSKRERVARGFYMPLLKRVPRGLIVRAMSEEGMTLQPYQNDSRSAAGKRSIASIVVFKLDHIGDFVVGLRALRAIRDGFPDARLTLVCASWTVQWARKLGWIDQVVPFDFFSQLRRDWNGPDSAQYDAIHFLSLGHYDLAIDLRHDPDTRPILYRIDSTYRAGFAAPVEAGLPFLDLVLPFVEGFAIEGGAPASLHAEFRLQLLASAVVLTFASDSIHPAVDLVSPASQPGVRKYAVFAIGAGDPIRCWPIKRYGELGRALIRRFDLDIVIAGGKAEQESNDALMALLPQGRARSVVGLALADMPGLLAEAAVCVCNGSGISHLSAALSVPTVCILGGAARMEVWHPAGPSVISLGGRTPCQPCELKIAADCPWNVACLLSVTAEMALAACTRLLAGSSDGDEKESGGRLKRKFFQ